MATLVLSTVGTALGGPVGSAIGALIGQSIDQELLAPASRGPRVGDLSVQSSSYGTQIPRVYGTMRIAGSVVWSTDLVEHSQTGGAKGQPDVTYSYTVSFAVALSSRTASSIGRIWADGNLLRGATGDLKVGGKLRFYDGGEDQIVDPFIASVEGIANTPAYRGITLAVFEDLELASFGNRMPFLTFELIADDAPPTLGAMLSDASLGAIESDASNPLIGYAAYGRSIRDAIRPLVEAYGVTLFDDGEQLRGAGTGAAATIIGEDEFGNSADQEQAAQMQRQQASARSLPASLRLTYYDPARDYQTAEARAAASEQSGTETQQDLAGALEAGSAKTLAQAMIARSWAARDKLTLRLPPKRLTLEPGALVTLPLSPACWAIDRLTVDGYVVAAELHPSAAPAANIAGESGRVAPNPDVVAGPLTVALIDVPDVLGVAPATPTLLLAASSTAGAWRTQTVEVGFGTQTMTIATARARSVLGNALGALSAAAADLIDDQNSVDVALVDPDQWLTSCDDEALAAGENMAVLGGEVLQFGQATPLGNGRFRLSHLLRGRGGTEWACGTHAEGETFCLLQLGTLQAVALPTWALGATMTARTAAASTSLAFNGESVRPVSPVDLTAEIQDSGDLLIGWVRRSRQGFSWVDEIDAPLGETSEQYRIVLTGTASTIELTSSQPTETLEAGNVALLGAGPVSIEVRQVGDFGVSRPAQLTINLP